MNLRLLNDETPAPALYSLRPTSFVLSVLVHCSLIFGLALIRFPGNASVSRRPIYDAEIKPYEKKIIWYPLRDTLPEVKGQVAYEPKFQGEIKGQQTVIARPESTTDSKQLVWQPEQVKEIKKPVESPNLIALAAVKDAVAPQPKVFVPPPVRAAQAPADSPIIEAGAEVRIPTKLADPLSKLPKPSIAPPKPRQFVAPPAPVKKTVEQPVQSISAPDISIDSNAVASGTVLRQLQASVPAAPSKPTTGGQQRSSPASSEVTLSQNGVSGVIVGLNPTERLREPLPEGARSGSFSTAPNVGSAGAPTSTTGSVPGLMVDGAKMPVGASVSPPTAPSNAVLYTETITGPLPSTLSAPLHPSSRTIPRAVEARFPNRTVYVLIVPAPHLPAYAGDWAIWYAEQESVPGSPRVRGPLPYRKLTGQPANKSGAPERRLVLTMIIDKTGRVKPTPDGNTGPVAQKALGDLKSWEFRPATRNGIPVEVEVMLDFMYREP
jgi:hypothetical protein